MTEPDHGEWEVGIIWLTRRLQRPDRMLRRRYRAARERRDSERADDARAIPDVLDGCGSFDDLGGFLVVLFVVALVVFFVALGPGLLAITIGLAEIVLLLLGAVIAGAGRVLLGQPWEIVARRGTEQIEWRVKGVRAAREMVGRRSG